MKNMITTTDDCDILLDDLMNSLEKNGINLDLIEFVDVTEDLQVERYDDSESEYASTSYESTQCYLPNYINEKADTQMEVSAFSFI